MRKVLLLLMFMILMVCLGSSEIYIQEGPKDFYNNGDEVSISFSLEESLKKVGYVDVYLDCTKDKRLIHKEFVSFIDRPKYEYNISTILDSKNERCLFDITFKNTSKRSASFNVSSNIESEVFLNSRVFEPGDDLVINGSVSKLGDEDFNYSLKVVLGNETLKMKSFDKNDFFLNLSIKEGLVPRDYELKIFFREKDIFSKVINSGEFVTNVSVLSVPDKIVIDSEEEIKPAGDLKIEVMILDQSKELVKDEKVSLKMYDPLNNLVLDTLVGSGENVNYSFLSNATMGGWRINAFYGSLKGTKPIYVNENREVRVDFVNASSKVSVTNVGNIPYEGIIEINLENSTDNITFPLNVELEKNEMVSEEVPFEGRYNVSALNKDYKNLYMTGAAISNGQLVKENALYLNLIPIVVLLIILFFVRRKVKGKREKELKVKGRGNLVRSQEKSRQGEKREEGEEKGSNGIKEDEKKKIYALFFRKDSEETTEILRRYNLGIYKMKGLRFSLVKSSKNPENQLITLAKSIASKTENKDILLHSTPYNDNEERSKIREEIMSVLRQGNGIVISDRIYNKIENKKDFVLLSTIQKKENIIKLYRLAIDK